MNRKYLRREIRKRPLKTFLKIFKDSTYKSGEKSYKVSLRNLSILFLGILINKNPRLTDTSEKRYKGITNCAKSLINRLSYFSNNIKRLKILNNIFKKYFFKEAINQISDNIERFEGRIVLIKDWIPLPKRARENKKGKGMKYAGKVYDSRKGETVRGYGDLLGGILLKDGNLFPITHQLYSNKRNFKKYPSMNKLELNKIIEVMKMLGEKILVIADAAFCKKVLLYEFFKRGIYFLIRLKKDIKIVINHKIVLLKAAMNRIKEVYVVKWEYKKKGKIKEVEAKAKFIKTSTPFRSGKLKRLIPITAIYVYVPRYKEPIFLLTLIKVTPQNLQEIVSLYNKRWIIETTIENLKNNFGLEKFMVREWEAIELIVNLILSIYAINIIILLTAKIYFFNGIKEILMRNSISAKVNLGQLIRAFRLVLWNTVRIC